MSRSKRRTHGKVWSRKRPTAATRAWFPSGRTPFLVNFNLAQLLGLPY